MTKNKRTKIGIIFGGRSSEHEISILSAASVIAVMDPEKYEPVPFAIDKTGAWYRIEKDLAGLGELTDPRVQNLFEGAEPVTLVDFGAMTDFAFPLLHGPFGEDGTIQGLFEMLGKPYAGCSVAASAISMDKVFTKEIWMRAGIPVCDHVWTTKYACDSDMHAEAMRIEEALQFPIFVKPANMGSSIGVSKVKSRDSLPEAINLALRYDKRVIVEKAICGRELEIGILGNGNPRVSEIGEILAESEYYDYDGKYKGGGAKLAIPCKIPVKIHDEIESLALHAYRVLDGEGFARIDLFYDEENEKVMLSEMNAIPGFTRFSMFPLLWQAKGMSYKELIEEIIGLGYERHNASHRR